VAKPIIGITSDSLSLVNGRGAVEERYFLKKALADAVESAGGQPVVLPFVKSLAEARNLTFRMDGLLISGGDFDIDPSYYKEKRHPKCGPANKLRTQSELYLLKAALSVAMPVMGVCGGLQLINVFLGGTLHQDIPSQLPSALGHSQKQPHTETTHVVKVEKGSILGKTTKKGTLKVNSTHHQGVKKLGNGLKVSATSPDGIVEAFEGPWNFLLAVQWHPEFLMRTAEHSAIFKSFVKAAQKWEKAASLE
jgi:putative glutamine amidotransferase